MIGAQESRDELGLDVEILEKEDERWKVIWEIWVRMEIFLQTYPSDDDGATPAKIFADAEEIQISG